MFHKIQEVMFFGAVKPQDTNHTQSTLIEHVTKIVLLAAIPVMFTESLSRRIEACCTDEKYNPTKDEYSASFHWYVCTSY